MRHDSASTLHDRSIVVDAVCPLVMNKSEYLDWYRTGGVTALAPTVGSTESARIVLDRIAAWHRALKDREDLMWVRRAQDIEIAKQSGRLGIYLHLQGTDPVEDNLDLIEVYKALGVGMIQLTYNVRNRCGDGCEESGDAGLSRFGGKLIERLNQARVIVDCSHTGLRTALNAIERSSAPVVLSHSNVAAVHPHPRNVSNELIDAIAATGGVVGVAGFPAMVSGAVNPSMNEFITHIDAIVQRVGIDYVGLGIDYYDGQHGVASDEAALADYEHCIRTGIWTTAYPPPPHYYPAGIETPRTLPQLTLALLRRGYTDCDVQKVLGQNWLRVMRKVWG